MDELEKLQQEIESLKNRMTYFEETLATLADMNKSGEMGQYIAQRQRALAASKLVNAAAGTRKLNVDAQQKVINQLATEKAAMDARIEEAIRDSMQNISIMGNLEEQFTYRMIPGEGIEILGFNGFNTSGELVIPEKIQGKPVVYIGKDAFIRTDFERVYLPKSIVSIGETAFVSCSQLKFINFPEGLTDIKAYAFIGCKKLETASFPQSLKTIGMRAFADTGVKNVVLPEKIMILSDGAFCGCTPLEKVLLNENLKTIESEAFGSTKVSELVVPKSETEIADDAFGYSRDHQIALAVLGMETTMKKIPENIIIYCLPGSQIQKDCRVQGKEARPLSEFKNN